MMSGPWTRCSTDGVPPELAETFDLLARSIHGASGGLRHLLDKLDRGDATSPDERRDALQMARQIGMVCRLIVVEAPRLEAELPAGELGHLAAMRVASELAYGLVGLATEEPERLALLSREELDSIVEDNGIGEWIDVWLPHASERGAA